MTGAFPEYYKLVTQQALDQRNPPGGGRCFIPLTRFPLTFSFFGRRSERKWVRFIYLGCGFRLPIPVFVGAAVVAIGRPAP
jgi:hypothetical protein